MQNTGIVNESGSSDTTSFESFASSLESSIASFVDSPHSYAPSTTENISNIEIINTRNDINDKNNEIPKINLEIGKKEYKLETVRKESGNAGDLSTFVPITISFFDLTGLILSRSALRSRISSLFKLSKRSTGSEPNGNGGNKNRKNCAAYPSIDGVVASADNLDGNVGDEYIVEMSNMTTTATTTTNNIVDDHGDAKVVLSPFTGSIHPGELLAVMGPSGSGKTTFLETIANRVPDENRRGSIYVNGILSNREISRECFGYVWQHDALYENLTVQETLTYVCRLRFNYSPVEVAERVREVMDELGLNSCASTKIGGQSFRGISGGERKRVSIAIELLANPSVLFLDEPTTGLDSATAVHIIQTLKKLASKNRTVVCTIHQPQTSIYRLFDKILLMSPGGKVVYFGEGGDIAVDYFENLGFKCDEFTNPSDHFLDIINTFPSTRNGKNKKSHRIEGERSITSNEGEEISGFSSTLTSEMRVEFLVNSYNSSPLKKRNVACAESTLKRFRDSFPSTEVETTTNSLTITRSPSSQNLDTESIEQEAETEGNERVGEIDVIPSTQNLMIPLSPMSTLSIRSLSSFKKSVSLQIAAMTNRKNTALDLLNVSSEMNTPTWWMKFYVLSLRQFKEYRRNKTATIFRLLQSIFIGLFIGLIYFQSGTHYDQKAAQDRRGVLFFLSMQQAMLGCITVTTLFHGWERIVFQREYSSSLYGSLTYYLSKTLSEIPFQITSPLIFGTITYFMVGLSQTAHQFFVFMVCIVLTTFCGQAFGIAISAWSPNIDIANVLVPIVLGLTMLCGGFFITIDNVPDWLSWTTQIDFVTYANQILAVNDLTGLHFTCDTSNSTSPPSNVAVPTMPHLNAWQRFWYALTSPFRKNTQTMITQPGGGMTGTMQPCLYQTGEDLLKSMSFDNDNLFFPFMVILMMTVGLHLLAFIGLKYYVTKKVRK